MADGPSVRSSSLGRYLPVDPAAANWDYPGVGFRFSRSSRSLRRWEGTRIAVVAECFLEEEMRGTVVEDQAPHIRWVVEAAVHDPPHVAVVVGLCRRAAEGSKKPWETEDHNCRRGLAEAVGRRQIVRQQEVVLMQLLKAVLLELRPVQVAVQRHHTRAYREEHHPGQPRQGQKRSSRSC